MKSTQAIKTNADGTYSSRLDPSTSWTNKDHCLMWHYKLDSYRAIKQRRRFLQAIVFALVICAIIGIDLYMQGMTQ